MDLPPEIISVLPPKWALWLGLAWNLWIPVTRMVKNLRAGDGLIGAIKGLLWGDKTPNAKAIDDAKVTAKLEAKQIKPLD